MPVQQSEDAVTIGSGIMVGSFGALHDAARARVGLTDFGGEDYQEGLWILLRALDEDLCLSDFGVRFATDLITGVLAARLSTQEGWKRFPQYQNVTIARPLVITGLPRTGSTALQKVLSLDPQFQSLNLWLTAAPMPRPPRETWASHPAYQRLATTLALRKKALPEFYAVHDVSIDTPDECMEVLNQSFVSNLFTTFGNSNYQTWWWRQDEAASYRRYADVLRLIGLNEPNRSWLLKSPGQHVWNLQCVFQVFPDACVVQTHRDPAKAIPSTCSLSTSRQKLIQGADYKPGTKGVPEALKWRHALDREKPTRLKHAGQIHDIRHRDFNDDPMGTIRGIYKRFDLTLTDQVAAAMQLWLDNQPAEQKSGHRYTAENFGLTEKGLRELYASYIQRFNLA
jgi:hypothetical protein